MAATEVSICNLALSHLGDSAKVSAISPPDGTMQAQQCAVFYPLARDLALAKHDWSFATRRAKLAEVVIDLDTYPEYEHGYALPSDCVDVIDVVGYPLAVYQREAAADGTFVLLCDIEPNLMYIRYVFRQVNPARYSAEFVSLISYELAAMLSGPIRKGDKREDMLKAAGIALVTAAGVDSNVDSNLARNLRLGYRPESISQR